MKRSYLRPSSGVLRTLWTRGLLKAVIHEKAEKCIRKLTFQFDLFKHKQTHSTLKCKTFSGFHDALKKKKKKKSKLFSMACKQGPACFAFFGLISYWPFTSSLTDAPGTLAPFLLVEHTKLLSTLRPLCV